MRRYSAIVCVYVLVPSVLLTYSNAQSQFVARGEIAAGVTVSLDYHPDNATALSFNPGMSLWGVLDPSCSTES